MNQRNVAASIRARLLNIARAKHLDFNLILTRYALERMLYRLSVSDQRDQFLLKGALLFDLWFDIPHRPTRDADLLGFGLAEIPDLMQTFRQISQIEVDDGIVFSAETLRATEIRKEANYAGVRLTVVGVLDGARCPVQIDVGFNDAVVPGPEDALYPVILDDLPSPNLRVYPRYTVIAEKLEAIVSLGILNTRMKDYFDLWVMATHCDFDGPILTEAIRATFARRATKISGEPPFGLTDEFAEDERKSAQWLAFQHKNALSAVPLTEVVAMLRRMLMPVLAAIASGRTSSYNWHREQGWSKSVS
ncbi:nucleotidyl transferase AbiEii/AbiGii toxin family protein [Bordetella sp. N]|uniref:nucleotidyl transferase AbiEii/AbiGii toxin family protein n=1 Tax=Bordetella sp. N TaxID=1746199 RepID=UPI00070AC30A|nr:nucleotidyl transferase AbiEii/AbiGii toxin family protein [Bordetella sp. N]ALM86600.1 hypothetical protein ASB57_30010 [Bordetella sp. N]